MNNTESTHKLQALDHAISQAIDAENEKYRYTASEIAGVMRVIEFRMMLIGERKRAQAAMANGLDPANSGGH